MSNSASRDETESFQLGRSRSTLLNHFLRLQESYGQSRTRSLFVHLRDRALRRAHGFMVWLVSKFGCSNPDQNLSPLSITTSRLWQPSRLSAANTYLCKYWKYVLSCVGPHLALNWSTSAQATRFYSLTSITQSLYSDRSGPGSAITRNDQDYECDDSNIRGMAAYILRCSQTSG